MILFLQTLELSQNLPIHILLLLLTHHTLLQIIFPEFLPLLLRLRNTIIIKIILRCPLIQQFLRPIPFLKLLKLLHKLLQIVQFQLIFPQRIIIIIILLITRLIPLNLQTLILIQHTLMFILNLLDLYNLLLYLLPNHDKR